MGTYSYMPTCRVFTPVRLQPQAYMPPQKRRAQPHDLLHLRLHLRLLLLLLLVLLPRSLLLILLLLPSETPTPRRITPTHNLL